MSETPFRYAVNMAPSGGELDVLASGIHAMEAGRTFTPGLEKNFCLYLVVGGTGWVHIKAGCFEVLRGDGILGFPNERLAFQTADEPLLYRHVSFQGTAAERLLTSLGITKPFPLVRSDRPDESAAWLKAIFRLLQAREAHANIEAEGYLRLLLAHLSQPPDPVRLFSKRYTHLSPNPIDHQLAALVEWLFASYGEPITVEEMAKRAGYHPSYFRKAFRKATGSTPLHFLRDLRMDRARHLLFKPLSIKQIAHAVGYADPLYFSKEFRRCTGYSPSEYRRYAKTKLMKGEKL